jgi:hypothetical protein
MYIKHKSKMTYSNFNWDEIIIHMNINDYEGTYNVEDVFNYITEKGEANYSIK